MALLERGVSRKNNENHGRDGTDGRLERRRAHEKGKRRKRKDTRDGGYDEAGAQESEPGLFFREFGSPVLPPYACEAYQEDDGDGNVEWNPEGAVYLAHLRPVPHKLFQYRPWNEGQDDENDRYGRNKRESLPRDFSVSREYGAKHGYGSGGKHTGRVGESGEEDSCVKLLPWK